MATLYRGTMMPASEIADQYVQLSSDKDTISDLLADRERNPHDEQYADQLIWASDDPEYARKLVLSRLVGRLATDQGFREAVVKGELVPCIVEYEVDETSNETMFSVNDQALSPISKPEDETVIGQAKGAYISMIGIERMAELLSKFFGNETVDAEMIVSIADAMYQNSDHKLNRTPQDEVGQFYTSADDEAGNMDDQIIKIQELGKKLKLTEAQVNELIAMGIFANAWVVFDVGMEDFSPASPDELSLYQERIEKAAMGTISSEMAEDRLPDIK